MSILGPLTIHDEPERTFSDGTVDRGGYRIDGDGIDQIAFVWRENRRCPYLGGQAVGEVFGEKQAEQYARLFAAAPDLLEALQMLHDNIAEYAKINNLGGFDNHDMRCARAAIAKATGEWK